MILGIPLPTKSGWILLAPVIPLCLASLITIQATSPADPDAGLTNAAIKQMIFLSVALVGMFAALGVGYHRIGITSYLFYAVCLAMLGYLVADRWVNVPLVEVTRNARRWIKFGPIPIQVSEIAKIAYVLALADVADIVGGPEHRNTVDLCAP